MEGQSAAGLTPPPDSLSAPKLWQGPVHTQTWLGPSDRPMAGNLVAYGPDGHDREPGTAPWDLSDLARLTPQTHKACGWSLAAAGKSVAA